MGGDTIHFILADVHRVSREGLHLLQMLEADIVVEAEASNGRDPAKEAMRLDPDVVIMDNGMPELNGSGIFYS